MNLVSKLKKFKLKNKNNAFFIVDIGSQTIKTLAVTQDQTQITVIGANKEWLEPRTVRSGYIIEQQKFTNALDNSLFKTLEDTHHNTNDVVFGISGSIVDCTVTTARITRGQRSEISKKEVDQIYDQVLQTAFNKAYENLIYSTGNDSIKLELVTSQPMTIKLDGNNVQHLENQIGNIVEIVMFSAFTPLHHLQTIQDIAKDLDLNIIAITPIDYSLNEALKIYKKDKNLDAILIDVGGDTTEISIIFNGYVTAKKSVNIGGNHYTSAISKSINISFAEAEKLKYDYTFNNLKESELVYFENIINEVNELWISSIELLFSDFEAIKTFPSNIYLTGGASKLPMIKDSLENSPWTKNIPFKEPPTINDLLTSELSFITDLTGKTQPTEFVNSCGLSTVLFEINNIDLDKVSLENNENED